MVHKLVVIKQPRPDKIPDRPIDFPPLENLHLELVEVKKKLKKGLPLIPIKPIKPYSKPKETIQPPPKEEPPKQKKKPTQIEIPFVDDEEDEDFDITQDLGLDSHHTNDQPPQTPSSYKPQVHQTHDEIEEEDHYIHEEEEEEEEEDDPYAGMSPEEREAAEKEEFIWRWRILKRKYKNLDVPEYNEHSDLQTMKTSYNRTVKELYLDDTVETYKTYLLGSFMAMEFVGTQWLNIDLSGFTKQQTKMMNRYERLLIELGEKSYDRWGMNIPVEIRLIGVVLIQAGMFYLGKVISSKFGDSVSELFKGISGQPPDQRSPAKEKPKRKMRGPTVKADDISPEDD